MFTARLAAWFDQHVRWQNGRFGFKRHDDRLWRRRWMMKIARRRRAHRLLQLRSVLGGFDLRRSF